MTKGIITDLQLLKALVSVSDCGSFTGAAERLNLTQSTVSQQVRRLEEHVGKALFYRHTRSVALTADGEIMREYAVTLLQISEEAVTRLSVPKLSGRLSIGASDDLAAHLLPSLLSRFKRLQEQVSLKVRIGLTADLCADMRNGSVDVVLGKSLVGKDARNVVGHDRLVWVGNPDLVEKHDVPLPLALYPKRTCVYRQAATEELDRCGRPWAPTVTSPSLPGILAAVEAGIAISPLAARFTNGLSVLEPHTCNLPKLPQIGFSIFYAEGTENPIATRQFVDLAREALSSFAVSENT